MAFPPQPLALELGWLEGPGLEGAGLEGPGLEGPGLEGPGLEGPGLEAPLGLLESGLSVLPGGSWILGRGEQKLPLLTQDFSPKLAWNHFYCLLLVKTLTEPTPFQETPPPGGRGCRCPREAIFAGNPRSPPACGSLLAWCGLRGCRGQRVPPVRRQQDARALRSLILLKTNKTNTTQGGAGVSQPRATTQPLGAALGLGG